MFYFWITCRGILSVLHSVLHSEDCFLFGSSPSGEHCVMWWEVSLCQHLQLQHQHLRPLLQVLPRNGPAAALRAALLQQQRHLGQLHHPGAHRLLLSVVLSACARTLASYSSNGLPPLTGRRDWSKDKWRMSAGSPCWPLTCGIYCGKVGNVTLFNREKTHLHLERDTKKKIYC